MMTYELVKKKKTPSPNKAVPGPFAYISPAQRTVLRTAIRGEPDTATSHSSQPTLQRKSNCSCGGSCPKCRAPSDAITQLGQVNINPNHIRLGSQDPIHQPLIDNYREVLGQPEGGIDETGRRVGPSDAELKYSGILARAGSGAKWLSPIINRQNAAEIYFRSTPLIDPPGGLTTQFINSRAIRNNQDVEAEIPRPSMQNRRENGRTYCWFSNGVSVTGHTKMDIFAPGPWEFIVSGAEAGERFASPKCQSRTGDTRIRVRGRPSDAALERYIRLGELEHEVDSKRAFTNFIAVYAKNVISLVGDTPSTRLSAPDVRQCNAKLRRLENRDLLTDFVIELNRLTAIRHARSRHSSSHTGLRISPDCSNVTADFDAGTL